MNFVEYVEFTDLVALYPKPAESVYLAMGIGNELGELVEAIEEDGEEVLAEAGDVFWYLLRYASKVLGMNLDELEERTMGQVKFDEEDFAAFVMKPLGGILGYEKKKIRDYDTWSDEKKADKKSKAVAEIHQLCFEVANVLYSHGYEVETALGNNVDKLSGRKEAGNLRGDGSNR